MLTMNGHWVGAVNKIKKKKKWFFCFVLFCFFGFEFKDLVFLSLFYYVILGDV